MTNHLHPAITHVTLKEPEGNRPEPRDIILKYVDRVVVLTSYSEDLPEGCTRLGDLDHEGNGLMVVPLEVCRTFHSPDEADAIMHCIDADDRLLMYAQG